MTRDYRSYFWLIFVLLATLFFFISLEVKMPYDKWLSEHLSIGLAIFICVLFGICFVVLAIPSRSVMLNYIAGILALLVGLLFKASYSKAPLINSVVIIISAILFIVVKYHYKKAKKKTG